MRAPEFVGGADTAHNAAKIQPNDIRVFVAAVSTLAIFITGMGSARCSGQIQSGMYTA